MALGYRTVTRLTVERFILNTAASSKLTSYLGPPGNVAPNLFLQSFGNRCFPNL